MTNHYQHARNDHSNATNVMKYIKPCRSNKSSLQSETTKNQRQHKIPRKRCALWAIQILKIRRYNSFVCTQAHSSHHGFSQCRKCSSTLCNIIIGSLFWRNCRLLWKLTVGSSLNVLLGMWITRILVIWIQNLTGYIKHEIFTLVLKEIIFTVSFKHITLYGMFYFCF